MVVSCNVYKNNTRLKLELGFKKTLYLNGLNVVLPFYQREYSKFAFSGTNFVSLGLILDHIIIFNKFKA